MKNSSASLAAGLLATRTLTRPHSEHHEEEEEVETYPEHVLFGIALVLGFGSLVYHNRNRLKIPYTVVMFTFGIVLGVIGTWFIGEKSIVGEEDNIYHNIFDGLADIPPELVLHIFLPILIFEGAYGMKTHAFWSIFSIALLLAGPGLLINTSLLAGTLKVMFPDWTWYLAGLLGSVLSSTDPVSVVALLRDLGVDKRLTAIVDGEAIMNEGTAIIMFTLLAPAAQIGEIEDPWYDILRQCFQFTVVAVIFGWIMGWITQKLIEISAVGSDLVPSCITIALSYMAFFVADKWLKTSGVLVLCFMGVYLATYMPTLFPGKEGSHLATTWHFLVHIANTVLFALIGVVIAGEIFPFFHWHHIYRIVIIYVVATIARFLMILMLKPLFYLNKNYSIGMREAALLVHGGLRGGAATMLAPMIYRMHKIPQQDRAEVMILTAGLIIMTVAVNATTGKAVVKFLGHHSKDQNRLVQMDVGIRLMNESAEAALHETRLNPFFTHTHWNRVRQLVSELHNPYEHISPVKETEERMFNVLLMRAFKTRLWTLRDEQGIISENVVRITTEAVSKCIAIGTRIDIRKDLVLHKSHMKYPTLLRFLYRRCFPKATQLSAT